MSFILHKFMIKNNNNAYQVIYENFLLLMKIGENKLEIISSISRNLFFSFIIKKEKKKRETEYTEEKQFCILCIKNAETHD